MLKTGLLAFSLTLQAGVVAAQDVPGIEICTVEKTMERRTSCLQSNVDFLQKSLTRDALDRQKKLDAAKAEIEALKGQLEALKGTVAGLQTSLEQLRSQASAQAAEKKPTAAPVK
jgi:predicted  nucleic acid-binding Zn-ribbon protein